MWDFFCTLCKISHHRAFLAFPQRQTTKKEKPKGFTKRSTSGKANTNIDAPAHFCTRLPPHRAGPEPITAPRRPSPPLGLRPRTAAPRADTRDRRGPGRLTRMAALQPRSGPRRGGARRVAGKRGPAACRPSRLPAPFPPPRPRRPAAPRTPRPARHTHFDAICAAPAALGRRRGLLTLRRLLLRLLLRWRLLLLRWLLAGNGGLLRSPLQRGSRSLRLVVFRHFVAGPRPRYRRFENRPERLGLAAPGRPSLARTRFAAEAGTRRLTALPWRQRPGPPRPARPGCASTVPILGHVWANAGVGNKFFLSFQDSLLSLSPHTTCW